MKCRICNKQTVDKFIDKTFVIDYCENCKLSGTTFKLFKDIVWNKLNNYNCNLFLKNLMLSKLETELFKYNFGFSGKTIICKNANMNECKNMTENCHMFEYNYYNLIFYFCLAKDYINFNENQFDSFFKALKRSCYFKWIIYSIKYDFIKLINRCKKIKNLFIKTDE